jgi:hypothetical protein
VAVACIDNDSVVSSNHFHHHCMVLSLNSIDCFCCFSDSLVIPSSAGSEFDIRLGSPLCIAYVLLIDWLWSRFCSELFILRAHNHPFFSSSHTEACFLFQFLSWFIATRTLPFFLSMRCRTINENTTCYTFGYFPNTDPNIVALMDKVYSRSLLFIW